MGGSQSLSSQSCSLEKQTNKIWEKFQTDFWFICHLQIKAAFTAVACQHRGRNLAGFICYFCWGEVVAQLTPCSVQLSLNPRIVLLSTTFPSLAKNQRRQMYSTWSVAFLWKCLLSFGRRQGFVSHINLIHTIVSFCQMTFQCTRSNQFSSVFSPQET